MIKSVEKEPYLLGKKFLELLANTWKDRIRKFLRTFDTKLSQIEGDANPERFGSRILRGNG